MRSTGISNVNPKVLHIVYLRWKLVHTPSTLYLKLNAFYYVSENRLFFLYWFSMLIGLENRKRFTCAFFSHSALSYKLHGQKFKNLCFLSLCVCIISTFFLLMPRVHKGKSGGTKIHWIEHVPVWFHSTSQCSLAQPYTNLHDCEHEYQLNKNHRWMKFNAWITC